MRLSWLPWNIGKTTRSPGSTADQPRERLHADRTYYVRPDGHRRNPGTTNSPKGAFPSVQHAIDLIWHQLDLSGRSVTISVADGQYHDPIRIFGNPVGVVDSTAAGAIRIIGNDENPEKVRISTRGTDALHISSGSLLIAGMTFQTADSGNGWTIANFANVRHRNVRFGAVADETIFVSTFSHVRALGVTTICGNSHTCIHVVKRAIADFSGREIIFENAPVFKNYLWGVNDASLNIDHARISGDRTGRVLVHDNGIINASALKGSYSGTMAITVDDGGIIAMKDRTKRRRLYVRALDGDDQNDGFDDNADRAFKTIQAAIDAVSKMAYNPLGWNADDIDAPGWQIVVRRGIYREVLKLRDGPWAKVTIVGNETNPDRITIISPDICIISDARRTRWELRGLALQTAGDGIVAQYGAQIWFRNIQFAVAGSLTRAENGGQVIAIQPSEVHHAAPC